MESGCENFASFKLLTAALSHNNNKMSDFPLSQKHADEHYSRQHRESVARRQNGKRQGDAGSTDVVGAYAPGFAPARKLKKLNKKQKAPIDNGSEESVESFGSEGDGKIAYVPRGRDGGKEDSNDNGEQKLDMIRSAIDNFVTRTAKNLPKTETCSLCHSGLTSTISCHWNYGV